MKTVLLVQRSWTLPPLIRILAHGEPLEDGGAYLRKQISASLPSGSCRL
jgi:hypothetical protein